MRNLYAIYDETAGKFLDMFFCENDSDAIRRVKYVMDGDRCMMNTYPSDFSLYHIAEIADVPGVDAVNLGSLIDLKEM